MLACTDVCYERGAALAACLVFPHWRSSAPLRIYRASVAEVVRYEAGAFYKRELPALLAVLDEVEERLEAVVVDGYVWLGDGTTPGLGAHLHLALGRKPAVIGVAKTRHRDDHCSIALTRGNSNRPLYVTAAGLTAEAAAEALRIMHGPARIPTLLRLADRACRS